MINTFDFQIELDESIQQANEALLAPLMRKRYERNLQAISQFDLNLAHGIANHHSVNYSPFITKQKYINISNHHKGRALYSVNPQAQVNKQLDAFSRYCPEYNPGSSQIIEPVVEYGAPLELQMPGLIDNLKPFSQTGNNLVILGCGLGLHLRQLLQSREWEHVLIVEPELDLLHNSLLSAQWRELLAVVNSNKTVLSINSGSVDQEAVDEIDNWRKKHNVEQFCVYRHYDYAAFNHFEYDVLCGRDPFADSYAYPEQSHQRDFEISFSLSNFISPSIQQYWNNNSSDLKAKFFKNIAAFERYMPDIANFARNHKSSLWTLITIGENDYAYVDLEQGVVVGLQSQQDCERYFDFYQKKPRIDALDARQSFLKPSPFIHYKHSSSLKDLVLEIPEEESSLPYKLPSLIMYGCQKGYQIENLYRDHQVDNFILYEPNHDFFFGSLHLIDWEMIFSSAHKNDGKIYLNIGDDGSNMFDDIHLRLQSYGIHILSYTFFFVSYFQSQMDRSIRDTREQFRVLLGMSEFYDHAFFNLNHTNESFRLNQHYLLRNKPTSIIQRLENTPVFIVGNGPSLDQSVETLREMQGKAIIVSVGTSLKALYELGIKPDMHAEVEQTRATLHWVCQVPDPDWLASIDLITVNGIHPDVSAMFRDTLFCFKVGEAGTISHQEIDPDFSRFEQIAYSYPTVSNCALSYCLKLGFKQIYLFGVDLGFKDIDKHHSKHSAYYNVNSKGEQLYDYRKHGVGLRVKGNFEDFVFTKQEFKYSAMILAQAIEEYPAAEVYNTSDGSFIEGTQPLPCDRVLLGSDDIDKQGFIDELKSNCYDTNMRPAYEQFKKHFEYDAFEENLDGVTELISRDCESWDDILEALNAQTSLIKASARQENSLFFYLVRGSATFCLTYLTRLAYSSSDEQTGLDRFNEGKSIWLQYLEDIKVQVRDDFGAFDQTSGPIPGKDFESLPALDILEKRKALNL
ncbi:DUF115 domain-containing protein [Alginatibacterium sediminis]|uniref:DUF115 domain-containing protein n=1 Tax=Alginatibacterium sediminis TaxID=2164068 RepID=A0A420EG04_9ALTE|nr:6-hydroxymethylpterin diphosphokinase MptE-like protein [Alginatibacterium sediminis]RKF19639.1 DUF115 domain-containing protein [Alginatibacterium sediminis]